MHSGIWNTATTTMSTAEFKVSGMAGERNCSACAATVTRKQFEAVREGLHPETGEFLRPRHSADRTNVDGSEQSKARSLYDLTFSAPKSVSVQALVGGDERLVAAHDKAVRETLAEAESHCCNTCPPERCK